MKIKLRGKIWKQITLEEHTYILMKEGVFAKIAKFEDRRNNETTYFKLVESTKSTGESKWN